MSGIGVTQGSGQMHKELGEQNLPEESTYVLEATANGVGQVATQKHSAGVNKTSQECTSHCDTVSVCQHREQHEFTRTKEVADKDPFQRDIREWRRRRKRTTERKCDNPRTSNARKGQRQSTRKGHSEQHGTCAASSSEQHDRRQRNLEGWEFTRQQVEWIGEETVSGDPEPSFVSAITKTLSLVMMNVRMYIREQFFLFVQDDSRHDGTKKGRGPSEGRKLHECQLWVQQHQFLSVKEGAAPGAMTIFNPYAEGRIKHAGAIQKF